MGIIHQNYGHGNAQGEKDGEEQKVCLNGEPEGKDSNPARRSIHELLEPIEENRYRVGSVNVDRTATLITGLTLTGVVGGAASGAVMAGLIVTGLTEAVMGDATIGAAIGFGAALHIFAYLQLRHRVHTGKIKT